MLSSDECLRAYHRAERYQVEAHQLTEERDRAVTERDNWHANYGIAKAMLDERVLKADQDRDIAESQLLVAVAALERLIRGGWIEDAVGALKRIGEMREAYESVRGN